MFASWYQTHIQHTLARQDRQEQTPPARAPRANATPANNANKETENKEKTETVFGPNIGLVSNGPSWTQKKEKKVLTDELTADVVRGWVEKSKDPNQPTTTLQALVNLKRPTLRLSPLAPPNEGPDEGADVPHQHHHGLEFEYDCDAPKCGMYVHVLLPPEHPEANTSSYTPGMTKVLVYESVVEGGFGKALKISDGAILELGRYDLDYVHAGEASPEEPTPGADASSANGGSTDPIIQQEANDASNPIHRHRRRFTHFHFRRRTHIQNRSVAGPALAVLDAETPADAPSGTDGEVKAKKDDKDDKEGVRITIRLAALDEQGTELSSPNEQVTYLHVLRFGSKPVAAEGEEPVEDTRPWVVKVVKREATIGPHTFQLHEIFGLSSKSHASHTPVPTASLPTDAPETHTYPPTATSPNSITPAPEHDDDPSSECLLCLSSPREVVLLPCRHLVACKECALNMVEFGAGGTITHTEEPTTATAATEDNANQGTENGEGANPTEATQAPATTPAPAPPAPMTRRKRKAKGWFCPVCRQPYTSLLRITTTPPPPQPPKSEEAVSAENPLHPNSTATTPGEAPATRPGFFTRSSFLRNFPRSPMGDVENQIRPVRA